MDTLLKVGFLVGGMALIGCQAEHHTEITSDTQAPEPLVQTDPQPLPAPDRLAANDLAAQPAPYVSAGFATAGGRSYTVQRGDTLWSIAARNYNDGHKWRDIQAANPGLQPNKLRVGQQILLP